jgi:mono/diheme cytochrome c family protein
MTVRQKPRSARRTGPLSLALVALAASAGIALAAMSPEQKAVHDGLAAAAKAADPAFAGFSAERGKAFFQARHSGGKAETPSCTSCHTADPKASGRTRAGKPIEPMAASVNAKRFTSQADVEKWFRRNCADVLGRACTPLEKGDVMAYLTSL